MRASGQGAAGATAASGSQLEAAFRFSRIMMVLDLDNKPAMMPTTPSHGHRDGLREGPEDPPAGAAGFMEAGHGARSCQWSLGTITGPGLVPAAPRKASCNCQCANSSESWHTASESELPTRTLRQKKHQGCRIFGGAVSPW